MLQEGFRIAFDIQVSTLLITAVLATAIYALLWNGTYVVFEKLLIGFVILMGLCFFVVFLKVRPEWSTIAQGLVPSIPKVDGAFGLIAAIAGTTCSAAVFVMRSTVVAEKGWDINHLKNEKRDAFVSAAAMLFLSAVIMAVAAGTLFVTQPDQPLNETVDLIRLFEPLGWQGGCFDFDSRDRRGRSFDTVSNRLDRPLAGLRFPRLASQSAFAPLSHFGPPGSSVLFWDAIHGRTADCFDGVLASFSGLHSSGGGNLDFRADQSLRCHGRKSGWVVAKSRADRRVDFRGGDVVSRNL